MKISTTTKEFALELHGKEQFWALRAKIHVPLASIEQISFEPSFKDWRKWQVRMPGTHAPKLLMAGSYWTEEGWDFLYAKRPNGLYKPELSNVLVVQTDQNKYKRIIINSTKQEAAEVIRWWKDSKKKTSKTHKNTRDKKAKN